MRKALVWLLAICVLCAMSLPAFADSWDFLHSAIRISSTDDLEELAAEHDISVSGWGDEGDFDIIDFTLEGIIAYEANAYRFSDEPAYAVIAYFHASGKSTAEEPGEEFEILTAALLARYGEPTFRAADNESVSMSWYFEDASVFFDWKDDPSPQLRFAIYGSSIMGDTKFPFPPTGVAAPSTL